MEARGQKPGPIRVDGIDNKTKKDELFFGLSNNLSM